MKAKYLLALAALSAAILAACGGKASFAVSGSFVNSQTLQPVALANSGLVLQNGGDTVSVPAGATTFTFPNTVSYGTEYNVTVKNQPNHMTCVPLLESERGSAGHTAAINVLFTCSQNSYLLSGSVSGLTADGLTIINGSSGTALTIVKGATTFNYPERVPVGVAYGLSVLQQPTGLKCTIVNGTDVMGDADRANIAINCVPG